MTEPDRDADALNDLSRLNNELTNLQRTLAKKNHELERLGEEKNRFLGMAAHDLRSPLSAISMYSDLLLSGAGGELSSEQQSFLHVIKSSSDFMQRLVNDLLDISQIESGKLSLELWPVDIRELIHKSIRVNQILAERKDVRLDFVDTGDETIVVADGQKVEQVLYNLLMNAIKYAPPQTRVTVVLEGDEEGIELSVYDRGPGVSPDLAERIFAPFVKHEPAPGEQKSTGLGLAIVKRIVEGHRGTVCVESPVFPEERPTHGSRFVVSLPRGAIDGA